MSWWSSASSKALGERQAQVVCRVRYDQRDRDLEVARAADVGEQVGGGGADGDVGVLDDQHVGGPDGGVGYASLMGVVGSLVSVCW